MEEQLIRAYKQNRFSVGFWDDLVLCFCFASSTTDITCLSVFNKEWWKSLCFYSY